MSRTRLWIALGFALVLAAGLIAVGCGGDDDDDGNGAAGEPELITEGTLTVGTDAPFPPFEIGRPPDITGYDIDVMNAVAEKLDLTPEYQDTSFDTIFRDVGQGRFDIAAAASTITPPRERTVDFSDPYYEAQQALVVTEDNDEITSVEDLGGAIVGAQDATTGETYANDETDASEVRGFPEGPDAIAAVRNGQVDAAVIDLPVAVDAEEKQGGVMTVEEIQTDELYGFAMAPDNDALREDVNNALTDLKDDGTITDLYQQYFKVDPPESVLEGTHEPQ